MKIAIGSDEKNYVTDFVIDYLQKADHQLTLYGSLDTTANEWPLVAQQVAESVAMGHTDEGILFCWTGTGVTIAANKVAGIRAALCADAETARGARLWNDANILCLSLRLTSQPLAKEILDAWFLYCYQSNEVDDRCLDLLDRIEQKYVAL